MPYVVKSVIERIPTSEMKPGDGFFLNDSFLGSGHYPDTFLVSPVYSAEELIGFVVNTAHQVDVGGAAPGSQKVHGVTEAFQEGLRILPVRLVKDGELDRDLMTVICGNVRQPQVLASDVQAQANSNYIGAQRLRQIFEEYGEDNFEAAVETILLQSETKMREFIEALPDGRYDFEDILDDCGDEGETVKLAVDVEIRGDEMVIDFSRSSDAVNVALNSYINYSRAYAMFSVKVFAGATLPQNEGMIRPITVVAREGSFFNPQYPAPSGGRATVQVRIFDIINGAMSKALPGRAMGGFSHWGNPNISGRREDGETYIFYDLIFGGYGARAYKDGAEAMAPVVNCMNIPIEVHESETPIRIHCYELIQDSAGDGKYRGGCGIRKDVELLAGDAIITLLGDRHEKAPFGLYGGTPGALATTSLRRNGSETALTSKQTLGLTQGDVVSFRLAGGGGYGSAEERDPDAVNYDVENGFVSAAHARDTYGFQN